jgi:hypothetical protein
MEKKSYLNINRMPTKSEYIDLQKWKNDPKNADLRLWAYDESPDYPNMYFLEYGRSFINGERWVYHPGFSKPRIRDNSQGFSPFCVNRQLTNTEYAELKNWTKVNSSQKWRSGDRRSSDGYIFAGYNRGSTNGEWWTTEEKFQKLQEKAYTPKGLKQRSANNLYNLKFDPVFPSEKSEFGQYTLFPVKRLLNEDEWEFLQQWIKDNPNLAWKFDQEHPQRPDYVFREYSKSCHAGEKWVTRLVQKRYEEKYKLKFTEEQRKEKRRLSVFVGRIRSAIANRFRKLGKTKNKKTEEILGLSFEDFRSYIESRFEPWMNWDNYGNIGYRVPEEFNLTWHLDHIIPTSIAENEWEIELLNHFSNFSPLCARENCFVKRDNLDHYDA